MDSTEALKPTARPPATVIAISMFWCLGACLEFLIWLIERNAFYLIVAILAAVLTVLTLKGFRWVFWFNLGQLSLWLGVTWLQLQDPGWAHGKPPWMLWISTFIAVSAIILHQFPSLRHWFGICGAGKRWQMVFWLLVAGLTALGLYVLPTIRAFRS